MVSAGRICCITAPFLLTIAVLVCTVLVFLAGTVDRNKTLDDLYFLKVSNATHPLRPHTDLYLRHRLT
jgi:hypothetical protein